MSDPEPLLAFASVMIDALAASVAARPLMWVCLIGAIVAITLCASDGLQHRGWRATGWGIVATSLLGVALAATGS